MLVSDIQPGNLRISAYRIAADLAPLHGAHGATQRLMQLQSSSCHSFWTHYKREFALSEPTWNWEMWLGGRALWRCWIPDLAVGLGLGQDVLKLPMETCPPVPKTCFSQQFQSCGWTHANCRSFFTSYQVIYSNLEFIAQHFWIFIQHWCLSSTWVVY